MKRLSRILLGRLILFTLAGITIVALLHVQSGLKSGKTPSSATTFSATQWVGSTTTYLTGAVQGNLGILEPLQAPGYTKAQPVFDVISKYGLNTGVLLTLALLISLTVGTTAGLLASRFGARPLRPLSLGGILLLLSTPDILLVLFVRYLVIWTLSTFGIKLFQAGSVSSLSDILAPALVLAALPMTIVARVSAVAFDDVHGELYIRTAVSKGLQPIRVILKHALKNAWIRIADAGPLVVGSLVTGLVVVEYVFYFPGLGRALGLVLEGGGQPSASAGIALTLLLGAFIVDLILSVIRSSLDPRLTTSVSVREPVWNRQAAWSQVFSFISVAPRQLWDWALEVPHSLTRTAWSWRPSRMVLEVRKNPYLAIGLLGMTVVGLLAIFGGQLADLRTVQHAPRHILHEGQVFFPPYKPGLPGYPLGSDTAGRDVMARLLVGARYTLLFTLAVTPVRFLLALPWGLLAGTRGGGWAGTAKVTGLVLSALPIILVPATLLPLRDLAGSGTGTGLSFWIITGSIAVVGVPRLVENLRLQVEAIMVQPFIEGARASGASEGRVLWRHVRLHLTPQLWVLAASDMAWTLLLLAQLGVFGIFLGGAAFIVTDADLAGNKFGFLVPRIPDWSSMLSKPYEVIYKAPWALWMPAVAFMIVIVFLNLVAEGLRRRAQQLAAAPATLEELEEVHGHKKGLAARHRLFIEWGAALTILVIFVGAAFKYGDGSTVAAAQTRVKTPVERARDDMKFVLETAFGTGDGTEKSRAVARIREVFSTYLVEAHKAGLTKQDILQETQNLVEIMELGGGLRLVYLHVPDGTKGSHLFFQTTQTGEVAYAATKERPTYGFLFETSLGPRVVLSGTVPGPDNWVISVWRGPVRRGPTGLFWEQDPETAKQVFARIPGDLRAKLVESSGASTQAWIELTLGPFNNARVFADGDLEICRDFKQPQSCTRLALFQGGS